MLNYTTATAIKDLEEILTLQKANLTAGLSAQEIQSQGFVTVNHSYELLKSLNDREKHVIARDEDKVVGYLLAMTQQSKSDVPVLVPMFTEFGIIVYKNKKVDAYNYIVVGQVCIDRNYRGQGILDNLYAAYKNYYSSKYDFAITEIASNNLRSLNAHKRIGFTEIHNYCDPENTKWIVIVWNWEKPG